MGCVVDHFYVLVPNSARNLDALKKLAAHVRWVVFMLMSDNSKANARFKAFVTMGTRNFILGRRSVFFLTFLTASRHAAV